VRAKNLPSPSSLHVVSADQVYQQKKSGRSSNQEVLIGTYIILVVEPETGIVRTNTSGRKTSSFKSSHLLMK
jgi:hypothetical protein